MTCQLRSGPRKRFDPRQNKRRQGQARGGWRGLPTDIGCREEEVAEEVAEEVEGTAVKDCEEGCKVEEPRAKANKTPPRWSRRREGGEAGC